MHGEPESGPFCTASRKPFSIAGRNSGGIALPISSFTNSKPPSPSVSVSGSMYPSILPYCPEPPLCFLCT